MNDPLPPSPGRLEPGAPLPPAEGVFWVRAALRFFRADALRWLGITAASIFVMQALAIVPGGVILAFLVKPVLTVGFLAAAWHQERSGRPEFTHLFFGFKSNLKSLIPLGLVYMIGVAVAITLAGAVSGVALDQMIGQDPTKLSPQASASLRGAMLWAILFMTPVTLALWFAPALIVFDDMKFTQALKASLRASARSIGAIVVYAIALFGLATGASVLVLGLNMIAPTFGTIALFMMILPFMAVLFISDYVSYRRVFHPNQPLRVP